MKVYLESKEHPGDRPPAEIALGEAGILTTGNSFIPPGTVVIGGRQEVIYPASVGAPCWDPKDEASYRYRPLYKGERVVFEGE